MVYPMEHILLRFNGHFGTSGGSLDRWSTGLRMGFNNIAPVYDAGKLQTLVNAAQAAAQVFHTQANVNAGTNCFFDSVSGAQIGVSGRYTPSDQLTIMSPITPTAGVGTAILPWNTASVISLRTARPRGRGSNGRCYWPGLAIPVTAGTGRVSVQTRVNHFKTFLDALNVAGSAYSTGMRVLVASNVGGGLHVPVTSIRSDDRLDSIERRENDQAPTWFSATLA